MNLWPQLLVSAAFVVLMTIIHGLGVIAATKILRLDDRTLRAHRFDLSALGLLVSIAICLFALHISEIAIFALFYWGMGALPDFETALFFSASAYSTLGHPEMPFPTEWRLVGAFEGLIGFLLIGWSTAVFIADLNKLLRE